VLIAIFPAQQNKELFRQNTEFWRGNSEYHVAKPKLSPDLVFGTHRLPPQCDIELMAQKQVLSLKPSPRLEQIADEYFERGQDGAHHMG
jgi:hypothetical protein